VQNPTTTAVVATGTGTARPPVVTGAAVGQINAIRATGAGASPAPNVVAVIVSGLPTNVGLGRVTGRFAVADIQAGDIDGIVNLYPDTTDTITFTSTSALLLDSTASPDPVVIIPDPIVCTLDANGYLVDTAGNRWVYLIATDDPDIAPATRRWRVTFSAGLGIPSFLMNVGTGSTLDLSTVIPTA
jgi:hypothetical protein